MMLIIKQLSSHNNLKLLIQSD